MTAPSRTIAAVAGLGLLVLLAGCGSAPAPAELPAGGPGSGTAVGPEAEPESADPCALLAASGLIGTLLESGDPYDGGALAPYQLAGCNGVQAADQPLASIGLFITDRVYFDDVALRATAPSEGAPNDFVAFTSPELGDSVVYSGYRAGWTDEDEDTTAEAGEYVISDGGVTVSLNFAVSGGDAPTMRAAALAIAAALAD